METNILQCILFRKNLPLRLGHPLERNYIATLHEMKTQTQSSSCRQKRCSSGVSSQVTLHHYTFWFFEGPSSSSKLPLHHSLSSRIRRGLLSQGKRTPSKKFISLTLGLQPIIRAEHREYPREARTQLLRNGYSMTGRWLPKHSSQGSCGVSKNSIVTHEDGPLRKSPRK